MMRDIHLAVELPFKTEEDQYWSEDILLRLLGVMSRLSLRYLKDHPDTPKLYESGVVYALPDQMMDARADLSKLHDLMKLLRDMHADDETIVTVVRYLKGMEIFRDIPTLHARKRGDCDNLVINRVAELWLAGIAASPCLSGETNAKNGVTYHAYVKWPDGSFEDPSLLLGMGGPERDADREQEKKKNRMRRDALMEAAKHLMVERDVSPTVLGEMIDAYGLVPRGGWRC